MRRLAAVLLLAAASAAQAGPLDCALPELPVPLKGLAAEQQLQRWIDQALAYSHTMQGAAALEEASQHELAQAESGADWRISASASVQGLTQHDVGGSQHGGLGSSALIASKPIWDGGLNDATRAWRAALLDAAQADTRAQRRQVALVVTSQALELGRAGLQLVIQQRHARRMACLAEGVKAIVEIDRGRASELLQAKKAEEQAALGVSQAEQAQTQALLRWRQLLGQPDAPPVMVAQLLPDLPPLDSALEAVQSGWDVRAQAARVEAAGHLARAQRAALGPQLSADAALSYGQRWIAGSVNGPNHQANVAIRLTVPITQPGGDSAVSAALARERAAREDLATLRDARALQMRDLYEQLGRNRTRTDTLQRLVALNSEVCEATLVQWQQLGRRTLFDVMGTQAEQLSLESGWMSAQYEGQSLAALVASLAGLAPLR